MRKPLIAAVFSVALALGYLLVTPVFTASLAGAAPVCAAGGGDQPWSMPGTCQNCVNANGYGMGADSCYADPNTPTAAPPPTPTVPLIPNPLEQPKNGCTVQGPGNLLKECPNYTCANILDDGEREQCNSAPPDAQQEFLNILGQENPTGLYPPPLTAAGTPPAGDHDDSGPCGSNSLCKSLVGIFVYTSGLLGKDEAKNAEPIQPGCCGIRG